MEGCDDGCIDGFIVGWPDGTIDIQLHLAVCAYQAQENPMVAWPCRVVGKRMMVDPSPDKINALPFGTVVDY